MSRSAIARTWMPGKGWRGVAGGVFDRDDGLRVHLYGLCRLPDGCVVSGMRWPESARLQQAIRVHGGNVRRGTLAWASRIAASRHQG